MPVRIQLRRVKGWRLPVGAISVARPGRWGNPYPVERFGRELAIRLFRQTIHGMWSAAGIPDEMVDEAYALHQAFITRIGAHPAEAVKSELKGCDLACWCGLEDTCHADVLLELANH